MIGNKLRIKLFKSLLKKLRRLFFASAKRYICGEITHLLKVKSRIWIEHNDQIFLGLGRVRLLEQILLDGSINKASKSLNMSYKKAWKLVDSMNKVSEKPLVKTSSGGKGGGGTLVTSFGKQMVLYFRELETKSFEFFDAQSKQLNDWK